MSGRRWFNVSKLVAVCVKKKITPNDTGFADFIMHLCAAYFAFDRRTVKKYISILIDAFRFDKWNTLVKSNEFLTEEEKQRWIAEHS